MGWDRHKSIHGDTFWILHYELLRIENRNENSEKLQNPILITIFDKKGERRILDCFPEFEPFSGFFACFGQHLDSVPPPIDDEHR